jgi:hypothetical protein
MFEILDSLIATVGVVLVLSLIVQAIQQIIKQVGSFKSNYMERELLAMFQSSANTPTSSGSPGGWMKTAIKKVAEAVSGKWLYEVVAPTALKYQLEAVKDDEVGKLIGAIKAKMGGLGYNDLSLLEMLKKDEFGKIVGSLDFAQEKLTKWKDDVTDWYDLTLKAFQDHYERRMKAWSYVLSFLVVVWLDANIFEIHKEFSSNKVLRDSAVKMAERLTSIPKDSLIVVKAKGGKDSLSQKVDTMALIVVQRQIAQIDSLVNANSFQIMRWNTAKGDSMRFKTHIGVQIWPAYVDVASAIEHNFFGWLAMTLLVGLGSPFWYDFLKSVMGIKEVLKTKSQPKE